MTDDAVQPWQTRDWSRPLQLAEVFRIEEPFRAMIAGVPGVVRGADPMPAIADDDDSGATTDPVNPVLHPVAAVEQKWNAFLQNGALALAGVVLLTVGVAALLFAHKDTVAKVAKVAVV